MTLEEKVDLLLKRQEQQDKALLNLATLIMGASDKNCILSKLLTWSSLEFIASWFDIYCEEEKDNKEEDDDNPTMKTVISRFGDMKMEEAEKLRKTLKRCSNIHKYIKKNLDPERFESHSVDETIKFEQQKPEVTI